jgi:phenylpyruvate tautomerase PptA (4-oxalocrotonate tautomerase family)
MPFIHVYAYSGRSMEMKRNAAAAMVKAASQAMNTPESSFTVIYEDIERDDWDRDVDERLIEPARSKMLIEEGKPV